MVHQVGAKGSRPEVPMQQCYAMKANFISGEHNNRPPGPKQLPRCAIVIFGFSFAERIDIETHHLLSNNAIATKPPTHKTIHAYLRTFSSILINKKHSNKITGARREKQDKHCNNRER
ncbi:hypothetical protein FRX31_033160 [Thalictrum thalictroides]|uniref:Uncharacterized protein n=1 Tax=Thalictrum thalictroides TaxID=46969 RepID=A0A7J6UYQ9_THATH|nr:hypothetical protein FRX31_033160 [Thalictrum thalictroides]